MTGPRQRPCFVCKSSPARLYMSGWLCREHAPPPAPIPDPDRTAEALRARYERLVIGQAKRRREAGVPP